jgi:MOSC domain-containing protein YiiM
VALPDSRCYTLPCDTAGVQGTIVQVSISAGGIPKLAVPEAHAGINGLEGDSCAHPAIHGGPEKAVLIITTGSLRELRDLGFDVSSGSLGENLTVDGPDARGFAAGQRYRAGGTLLELTKPRKPCRTLDVYGRGIQRAVGESLRGGFYARVIRPGLVRTGDIIALD